MCWPNYSLSSFFYTANFLTYLWSADFFKINFLKNYFRKFHQCQTVWILIRPDVLSGLIWVQTVCKGYQQTTLEGRVKSYSLLMSCVEGKVDSLELSGEKFLHDMLSSGVIFIQVSGNP